jgi:hypothetical protein
MEVQLEPRFAEFARVKLSDATGMKKAVATPCAVAIDVLDASNMDVEDAPVGLQLVDDASDSATATAHVAMRLPLELRAAVKGDAPDVGEHDAELVVVAVAAIATTVASPALAAQVAERALVRIDAVAERSSPWITAPASQLAIAPLPLSVVEK